MSSAPSQAPAQPQLQQQHIGIGQLVFSGVENNQLIRLEVHPSEKLARHLGVYIIDAAGVPLKEGKVQPFVAEVSYNNKSYTTHSVKDINPKWESMYRFPIKEARKYKNILNEPPTGTVTFKVWMKSSLKSKLIGTATVDLKTLPLETVVEQTLTLSLPDDNRKKGASIVNTAASDCTLNVRMHVSTLEYTSRNHSPVRITDPIFDYPYSDRKDEVTPFKPGDIILFNMPGTVSSVVKLHTGMQWSHCGMVAMLPKKWCGKQSLCIVEFSQNLECFNDIYAEFPLHNGMVIYDLEERLHGCPGTEIWHMPMKAKYSYDDYTRALRNWVLETHNDFIKQLSISKGKHIKLQFEGQLGWTETEQAYLKSSDIDPRDSTNFCELYSAQMCATALAKSYPIKFKRAFTEISDLLHSGFFDEPYLVRCRPEHSSNICWPSAQSASPAYQHRRRSSPPPQETSNSGAIYSAINTNDDSSYSDDDDDVVDRNPNSNPNSYAQSGGDSSQNYNTYQQPPPQPPQQQQQQQQQEDNVRQDIYTLEQQIAAESKALSDMSGLQESIPKAYESEFLAIQQGFKALLDGFCSLKAGVTTSRIPLNENQLKEAQIMADRHSDLSAQTKALLDKINAGPTGTCDAHMEEIQAEGNRQLDLLNRQISSTLDSLRRMDSIRHLVPPNMQERYNGIYQAIKVSYDKFCALNNHVLNTHQILDDSQLQEAQQCSVYFSSAWTDMNFLCQELRG